MIKNLVVHLKPNSHCKEGTYYLFEKDFPVKNSYLIETGIENTLEIIKNKKPEMIIIYDEPDFLNLAKEIHNISPNSINLINDSAYEESGIRIKKENNFFEILSKLDFIIYCSGYETEIISDSIKSHHSGELEKMLKIDEPNFQGTSLEGLKGVLKFGFKSRFPKKFRPKTFFKSC